MADYGAFEYQQRQATQAGIPCTGTGDSEGLHWRHVEPDTRIRLGVVTILVVMLSLLNILVTVYDFWHSP
jgi:hypothetical protein